MAFPHLLLQLITVAYDLIVRIDLNLAIMDRLRLMSTLKSSILARALPSAPAPPITLNLTMSLAMSTPLSLKTILTTIALLQPNNVPTRKPRREDAAPAPSCKTFFRTIKIAQF